MNSNGLENKAYEHELEEYRLSGEPDLLPNSVTSNNKHQIDANANNATIYPGKELEDVEKLEDDDEEFQCGIGCFSPPWVQKFATKKAFMVVFTLLGVIQGMTWSYFTATISTLEKRFKISSQTAGIVMTGNECSQIIFSLLLSYYGGKGHRPRWIAVGVLFSALACFVLASPQLFYGSGDDALALTEEFEAYYDKINGGTGISEFSHRKNGSSFFGPKKGKVTLCDRTAATQPESCDAEMTIAPLILIFLSQFVAGIGVLLFFTLGGPYLDDNTKRTNIPIVFGITMSLRLIGPTFGFLIASGALKLYINPLLTPLITPEDPRWIGCWWLGWVIFGSCMTIASFFIALFPRRLRRKNGTVSKSETKSAETIPKLSEIPSAVKLLLKNKINVLNNLAGVFYLFSGIGYWTYMPKYLESIFLQTASNASIISGVVGILSQSTGMLLSGFLISRFKFSARKLAAWNVFTAFLYVAVKISFTQIGCNVGKISFGTQSSDGTWNLSTSCNEGCNCRTSKILPVCYKEQNTVFYSACHAGCTEFSNGTIGNCSCIPDPNATVTLGNCAEGCAQIFILFLAISAAIKFMDATGRIGNMLISYRCVSLEERSLSIGLNILLISALAFLPSPILFGRIIDSVCLVWGGSSACGKRGNCMLYNSEQLRYVFNLTAASFTFMGGLLDCLVWYYVKDMDLYTEPDAITDDNKKITEDKQKQLNSN